MSTQRKTSRQKPAWEFPRRFRRTAFGWRGSKLAITRIGEALAEIRAVGGKDVALAAEGAVLLLEKLSPALSDVDSSSGALGSAANAAVDALVPVIASAPVGESVRQGWLERLFEALQDDDPPYLESLGCRWGDLCAGPALASRWADDLLSLHRRVLEERRKGAFGWFKGSTACYSALLAAGRHEELLELLEIDPRPVWMDLLWGARVLAARGQVDASIDYLIRRAGPHLPEFALARFAEDALLKAGRRDEAYAHYALDANQAGSHIATYRAIAKKYPEMAPDRLLSDLIESMPGAEGKWFATAKTLKRFDLATRLAWKSPTDPRTLIRAARDHLNDHPVFAAEAALAALHWISMGHGYELTGLDLLQAVRHARDGGERAGQSENISERLRQLLANGGVASDWLRKTLAIEGFSREALT